MYYETQVIYGSSTQNENEFSLNGIVYYRTKTGRPKMLDINTQKRTSVTEEHYGEKWTKFQHLFYN